VVSILFYALVLGLIVRNVGKLIQAYNGTDIDYIAVEHSVVFNAEPSENDEGAKNWWDVPPIMVQSDNHIEFLCVCVIGVCVSHSTPSSAAKEMIAPRFKRLR
jgi:hypothetical protein